MLTFFHRRLGIPYHMHVRDDNGKALRPRATVVFVHGIGNTGATWDAIIADMPDDIRLITVDLLGFGNSPKPDWLRYDVVEQARSLRKTLQSLRVRGPVVIVGHSLGTLIAIEYARRYNHTQSLILCAPPLYSYSETSRRSLRIRADDVLRRLYHRVSLADEAQLLKLVALATRYKLVAPSFAVTDDNVRSYVATLSASIIQQTSLNDAAQLQIPIHIIRGRFDPVVLAPNLQSLRRLNQHVSLQTIAAGHDIAGKYIPAVTAAIQRALS